jgi:ABC-type tungstate transport system permease subunit
LKPHPASLLPPNDRGVFLTRHSRNQGGFFFAEKFYEFLISGKGQQIIANFGVKQFSEPIYYPWEKK